MYTGGRVTSKEKGVHKAKVGGTEGKVWGQGPIRQRAGLLKGGTGCGEETAGSKSRSSHFLYFFPLPS